MNLLEFKDKMKIASVMTHEEQINCIRFSIDNHSQIVKQKGDMNLIIVMEELSELQEVLLNSLLVGNKMSNLELLEEMADVSIGLLYLKEIFNIKEKEVEDAIISSQAKGNNEIVIETIKNLSIQIKEVSKMLRGIGDRNNLIKMIACCTKNLESLLNIFEIPDVSLDLAISVKLKRTDERIKIRLENEKKNESKIKKIPYIDEDFVLDSFHSFVELMNFYKDKPLSDFKTRNFLDETEFEEEYNKEEIRKIFFALETLIRDWLKENLPNQFAIYSDYAVHVVEKEYYLRQLKGSVSFFEKKVCK